MVSAFKTLKDQKNKVIDSEWTLTNNAFQKLFNIEKEILAGNRHLDQLPGIKETGLFDKCVDIVEKHEALHTLAAYYNKWLEVMGVNIENGIAPTITDVNEKKIAEQKMTKAYEDLKNTDPRTDR